MGEMFRLLKELTVSQTPDKVLVREGARQTVTKHINSISLVKIEKEKGTQDNAIADNDNVSHDRSDTLVPMSKVDKKNESGNGVGDEVVKCAEEKLKKTDEEKSGETPNSQPVGYYLKHKINKKLVEGLIENQRFNDSLSATRVGKMKRKTYNLLPRGPVYEAILQKKITRKEDLEGNFEILCSIGGLKYTDALVDQGSDINIMPLSTYKKLTDERPVETDIRLYLANYSYIYPLGIAEDVLVDIAGYERIKLHLEKEMKFDQWRSKNFNDKRPAPIEVRHEVKDEEEVTQNVRLQV
ncbi:MAK10-like protein [Tanacetum coccineum]